MPLLITIVQTNGVTNPVKIVIIRFHLLEKLCKSIQIQLLVNFVFQLKSPPPNPVGRMELQVGLIEIILLLLELKP